MRRYLHALEILDELICKGQGESDEAEALRDQMDPWWWALTEAERQAIKLDLATRHD